MSFVGDIAEGLPLYMGESETSGIERAPVRAIKLNWITSGSVIQTPVSTGIQSGTAWEILGAAWGIENAASWWTDASSQEVYGEIACEERLFGIEGPRMITSFRWQSLVGVGGAVVVGPSTPAAWWAPAGLLIVADRIVFTASSTADPVVGFWRLYYRTTTLETLEWQSRRSQIGL